MLFHIFHFLSLTRSRHGRRIHEKASHSKGYDGFFFDRQTPATHTSWRRHRQTAHMAYTSPCQHRAPEEDVLHPPAARPGSFFCTFLKIAIEVDDFRKREPCFPLVKFAMQWARQFPLSRTCLPSTRDMICLRAVRREVESHIWKLLRNILQQFQTVCLLLEGPTGHCLEAFWRSPGICAEPRQRQSVSKL